MTNAEAKQITVGTRLGTMILDHFIMSIVAMLFYIPELISGFSSAFGVSHEQEAPNILEGNLSYIGLFGFSLYICKDIINGRSFAKRILKLHVVDYKTGQAASPMQCLIRNLFLILWPLEVIIALSNTERRLGDRVAGTKLIYFNPESERPKFNFIQTLIPIGIAYGIVLLLFQTFPKISLPKTNYSKTSINLIESKELEKLLLDSLGQYLTPDVRVYDTVKNSNLKYVSVILKLKNNYLKDDNASSQLGSAVENLIYSKIPIATMTGKIRFVYQSSGQFHSKSGQIGTIIKSQD